MSIKFRAGCDPEVFLQDATGKHISVIGYINADKWHPMQIPNMAEGFTLQEDNVALEYGVPPAASAQELFDNINAVMKKSLEYLPNLSFSKLSCTVFEKDQLLTPQAHIFGCEPDFNAWTCEPNPPPNPPHPFMRSAGGHIHVETKVHPLVGVKAMDLFLGVPSVLMDEGEERKQLYGKGGAHRPKPYGFEYRTLSNFWIAPGGTEEERRKYAEWVWKSTELALSNLGVAEQYEDVILDAINNNNKKAAKHLVKQLGLIVV